MEMKWVFFFIIIRAFQIFYMVPCRFLLDFVPHFVFWMNIIDCKCLKKLQQTSHVVPLFRKCYEEELN